MKAIAFFLFAASLFAQTTTITATTPVINRQGAALTGSICLGATLFASSVPCQPIAAGIMAQYVVPNATYAIWINEGSTPIFTATGIAFSGTPIASDSFLAAQFGMKVGTSFAFVSTANPSLISTECAGNAVVLPGNPTAGLEVQISNSSATTACTLAGGTIRWKGATLSPSTLAAQTSMVAVWTLNYDLTGTGHNAWIVSHIGT